MKHLMVKVILLAAICSSCGPLYYAKPVATKRYMSGSKILPSGNMDLPVFFNISYDSASYSPERDKLLAREPGFSAIVNHILANKDTLLNFFKSRVSPELITQQDLLAHFQQFGKKVQFSGNSRFELHRPVPNPTIFKYDSISFVPVSKRVSGIFMDFQFCKRERGYDDVDVEGIITINTFLVYNSSVLYARTWGSTSFWNRASPKLQLGNSAMDNVVWYPKEVLAILLNAIKMDIRKSLYK